MATSSLYYGQAVDPGRITILHEGGKQALGVMDSVLARQPYMAGSQFSIADIALYAYTHVAADGGFDTREYPAVQEWLARVAGRPGHFDMAEIPF